MNLHKILALVFLVFIFSLCSCDSKYDRSLKVRKLMEIGEYEEAIVQLEKNLEKDSSYFNFYLIGRCYSRMGQHEKAIDRYNKAISNGSNILNDGRCLSVAQRALSKFELKRYETSLDDIDRYFLAESECYSTYNGLRLELKIKKGIIHFLNGDYKTSLKYMSRLDFNRIQDYHSEIDSTKLQYLFKYEDHFLVEGTYILSDDNTNEGKLIIKYNPFVNDSLDFVLENNCNRTLKGKIDAKTLPFVEFIYRKSSSIGNKADALFINTYQAPSRIIIHDGADDLCVYEGVYFNNK